MTYEFEQFLLQEAQIEKEKAQIEKELILKAVEVALSCGASSRRDALRWILKKSK